MQCGEAVHQVSDGTGEVLKPEDATDPLLKRALWDATDGEIEFKDNVPVLQTGVFVPPVAEAAPVVAAAPAVVAVADPEPKKKPGHTFLSLRAVMAPPRPATTNGAMVMPPLPQMASAAEVKASVAVAAPASSPDATIPGPSMRTPTTVVPGVSNIVTQTQKGMAKAWVIGLAGLALFISINMAIGSYYSSRVYPGVRVGNLAVGGWTFDQLHTKLPADLKHPSLAAMVGDQTYALDLSSVGSVNVADLEISVRQAGRSTALPLAGLLGSWFARPISPAFALTDDAVDRSVQALATSSNRAPSNAAVMVHGTDVLLIADKPGVTLDQTAAAEAIRTAYGHAATASINPVTQSPSVVAADYANDVVAAQTTITTSVQIVVKKAHYSPTAGQIASWVVFLGPGKGVMVDGAGVAAFVTTIPGSFDRTGTVNGVVAALNAHQSTTLTPSTKKPTGNPKVASIAVSAPVASYAYCIDETTTLAPGLAAQMASVLGAGGSWTLGGKLSFVAAKTGCNFTVRLADIKAMAALDPACEKQTTCRLHNDLYIATGSWAKAPTGWVGDVNSYRSELINHVVGQWLGFSHPSCTAEAAQEPVLTTTSVTIPGCSPKWYPVPPELQDTKILPGF